jgi:hypothetical protein
LALRLAFLCDWLPPDFGAVGQYALIRARERAAAGEQVTLVGLSASRESVEDEAPGAGSLRIVRIRRPVYDRASFWQRATWTFVTNVRLIAAARGAIRDADELLFTGSPPFLVFLLVPLNALVWRRRLTYRITDFFPEVLIADHEGRAGLGLRLLLRATIALRRRVAHFEVLGEDQRRRLREIGIPDDRIALVPDPSPVAILAGTEPLPLPEALRDKVVLLYSGNYGVAHDHETFAAGYRKHHREGSGRVALWLNATGAKADRVEAELRAEGLPVHRTRPGPLEELPRLLATPAAHLITLRDSFVGYVLPSKVHACIASRRDVLFVGSAGSDVHRLCAAALPGEAYRRVDVGDGAGVARALEAIADRAGTAG